MLVDDMIARFEGQKRRQSIFDANMEMKSFQSEQQQQQSKRRVKASDLVRMYDTLIDHVRELRDIAREASNDNVEDNQEDVNTTAEMILRLNRCFYIAKSFEAHEKFSEAFALYEHVTALIDKVQTRRASKGEEEDSSRVLKTIQKGSNRISRVSKLVSGAKIRCHAKAFATTFSSINKNTKKQNSFLSDRLYKYDTSEQYMKWSQDENAPFRVAAVPPRYEPVPCKPCLFDIAFTKIKRHSLLHRLDKSKQEEVKARRMSLEEEDEDDFDSADEAETQDVPDDEGDEKKNEGGGGGWLGGWFG